MNVWLVVDLADADLAIAFVHFQTDPLRLDAIALLQFVEQTAGKIFRKFFGGRVGYWKQHTIAAWKLPTAIFKRGFDAPFVGCHANFRMLGWQQHMMI